MLQSQNNEQSHQRKLDAGAVKGDIVAKQCTNCAPRHPVTLVKAGNSEIDLLFVGPVASSWAAGEQGIGFIGQTENQIEFSPARALELAQQ